MLRNAYERIHGNNLCENNNNKKQISIGILKMRNEARTQNKLK